MREATATTELGWQLEVPAGIGLVIVVALLLPAGSFSDGREGRTSLPAPAPKVGPVPPRGAVGTPIDWPIPLSGGCGGPYVMGVTDGALPPGVTLDDANHGFRGTPTEAGDFGFQLQLDDTGCTPFMTTSAWIEWHVDPAPTRK